MKTEQEFKRQVKAEIIRQARRETINKPEIKSLSVNEFNGLTYRDVTCEIVDSYTHPITHERTIERYSAIFDGKLTMRAIS